VVVHERKIEEEEEEEAMGHVRDSGTMLPPCDFLVPNPYR
jgi:hypothetical protein